MEEKLTSSPNYNRGLTSATVGSSIAEGKVDVKEILENFIIFSKKIIDALQRSTIYKSCAPRCSCAPLARRAARTTVDASRGSRNTESTDIRKSTRLRLRLSFGRRAALVGESLNQRVDSFTCSVRRTSPPTACGSYTRATVGSGSFGLARKREPPVRLRTAALFAVGPIV